MRFALVVLVACSNPPRERAPIPPPPPPPPDAAIDATIDAAPTAHVPLMRCRGVNGPSNRFPRCTEDGKVVELAQPIVLAISRHGTSTDQGTPVIVEGGTNRGVDKRWRATLLDAKQREMGDATFTRLDLDRIEVLAPMAAERIDNFARSVRFTPPEGARLVIPPPPPKPDPIVLKIVRRGDVTERGTRILVAGGTRRGIDKTWRVDVLDAQQRPLRGGAASFARLDPDEIEIVVRLTPDELDARARTVRFTPP